MAFSGIDRLVFAGLYRLAPGVLDALKILKPETVIRWHRAGFRILLALEVAFARRLSVKYNWALLDVTRRSIEETAAAVLKLFADRQRQRLAE